VVLQFDRSDCWKVTEIVTYRSRTVAAVFVNFLVSCSLFHLFCLAICPIIEYNLCCDLRLSCNINFDHSGAWLTGLCPWFFLLTLRRFSTLKFMCLPLVCFCCYYYLLLLLTDFCKLGKLLFAAYCYGWIIILLSWIFHHILW